MGSHQWKKSCVDWTTSFAKARFSTSASRTLPLGGSLRQILWRSFEAGHIGLQIEYSLMERTVERELVPMAKALNLGILAWSPLPGGVLSGKYHGEGKADGGRMTNEGMKDLLPEEQRAAPIISA